MFHNQMSIFFLISALIVTLLTSLAIGGLPIKYKVAQIPNSKPMFPGSVPNYKDIRCSIKL